MVTWRFSICDPRTASAAAACPYCWAAVALGARAAANAGWVAAERTAMASPAIRSTADDLRHRQEPEGEEHEHEGAHPPLHKGLARLPSHDDPGSNCSMVWTERACTGRRSNGGNGIGRIGGA